MANHELLYTSNGFTITEDDINTHAKNNPHLLGD